MSLQILVSFSQLSSRYASAFKLLKYTSCKSKHVKGKQATASLCDANLCSDSFDEALRNFDKDVLAEMRKFDVASTSRRALTSQSLLSSRKVSYVSTDSFVKNKNGWTEAATPTITIDLRGPRTRFSFTDNFAGLLAKSIQDSSFKYNVHVRGFKTERSVHADLKRNPNLVNRLRKFLGQYVLDCEVTATALHNYLCYYIIIIINNPIGYLIVLKFN